MSSRKQQRHGAVKAPAYLIQRAGTANRLRQKLAVKQGEKKLCLTMIVKNESKIIGRLLDSVKSVIDMVSIVDTGSTDNTEEIILKWGKENNVPAKVHHEPFQDFAYNRTHSVRAAKQAFPDADYFLLSDADFVWDINVKGTFSKILLIDHKYLISQYNRALNYWNIRLLSAKVDWECIGVTHEYWRETKDQSAYSGEVRTAKITTLAIDDREDGGAKGDKFERDVRLLTKGLADEKTPKDLKTRYKFYLAQTLKDMGRNEESIKYYSDRILDNGWQEEIYYSYYQVGFNHEQLYWKYNNMLNLAMKFEQHRGEISPEEYVFWVKQNPTDLTSKDYITMKETHYAKLVEFYIKAHDFRKTRAEALYNLTRFYRMISKHKEAYDLAKVGKKIPYPEHDTLFIDRNCHSYLFDFEISIVGFYLPEHKEEARKKIEELLVRTDLPDEIKRTVEHNSRCFI